MTISTDAIFRMQERVLFYTVNCQNLSGQLAQVVTVEPTFFNMTLALGLGHEKKVFGDGS